MALFREGLANNASPFIHDAKVINRDRTGLTGFKGQKSPETRLKRKMLTNRKKDLELFVKQNIFI
jgi:hypothetical protein